MLVVWPPVDGKSKSFYGLGRYGLDATGLALKLNSKEALTQEVKQSVGDRGW